MDDSSFFHAYFLKNKATRVNLNINGKLAGWSQQSYEEFSSSKTVGHRIAISILNVETFRAGSVICAK